MREHSRDSKKRRNHILWCEVDIGERVKLTLSLEFMCGKIIFTPSAVKAQSPVIVARHVN